MTYSDIKTGHCALLLAGICILSSCSKELPAPTVVDFMEDGRLLEATMIRCAADRSELKYTQECINAREAVERLAAQEDAIKRRDLEAESTRKREALRRAQQAAAEARLRAEEAERLRRESEYLQQFDELPARGGESVPPPSGAQDSAAAPQQSDAAAAQQIDAAAAPPEEADSATLDEVREELRKRQQAPQP
ncbi:MAG: EexN family lipoprotein [Woeseia sp.]